MSSKTNSINMHFAESDGCFEVFPGISLCFVIFTLDGNRLKVLCEFKDATVAGERWVLPHGKIFTDEGVRQSAARALKKLVPYEQLCYEQLHTFGGAGLTPLTIAYYVLLSEKNQLNMTSEKNAFRWWDVKQLPHFDGEQAPLIDFAVRELRARALYGATIFRLLPTKFTLLQLQQAYETVLDLRISKSNFRRKVAKMRFLTPSQEWQQGVAHRAARLYEFDEELYMNVSRKDYLYLFGTGTVY